MEHAHPPHRIGTRSLIAIAGVFFVGLVLIEGAFVVRMLQLIDTVEVLKARTVIFEQTVSELQESYLAVREELAEMTLALAESVEARLDAEAQLAELAGERARLAGEVSALSGAVARQQRVLEQPTVTDRIAEWSPRVARVSCTFRLGPTRTARSSGSAVATLQAGVPVFVTNAHIIDADVDLMPISCEVNVPERDASFTAPGVSIQIVQDRDIAYIPIPPNDRARMGVTTAVRSCDRAPALGDALFILGYPGVGARESITVTEGIVSGFDNGFIITSAKIERGNSGGAAVHVRDNCFLGIPTLAVTGPIESLARILPL